MTINFQSYKELKGKIGADGKPLVTLKVIAADSTNPAAANYIVAYAQFDSTGTRTPDRIEYATKVDITKWVAEAQTELDARLALKTELDLLK